MRIRIGNGVVDSGFWNGNEDSGVTIRGKESVSFTAIYGRYITCCNARYIYKLYVVNTANI